MKMFSIVIIMLLSVLYADIKHKSINKKISENNELSCISHAFKHNYDFKLDSCISVLNQFYLIDLNSMDEVKSFILKRYGNEKGAKFYRYVEKISKSSINENQNICNEMCLYYKELKEKENVNLVNESNACFLLYPSFAAVFVIVFLL